MRPELRRFSSDESGATAIEYGLLAALIGVVVLSTFQALGLGIYAKLEGLVEAVYDAGS